MSRPEDHVDEIVAQWRRERPELDVAPLGVYGRLFRVVNLSDDEFAKGLVQYGLQPGWFDFLAALRRAGAPYELNPTSLMRAAKSAGVETTVFDRGGYLYHGRVKALADSAREGGLKF